MHGYSRNAHFLTKQFGQGLSSTITLFCRKQLVVFSEDGIETLQVFKQASKSTTTEKTVNLDDLKNQLTINRDDWDSIFSYCFDNHNFSYVILDKNTSRILNHGNKQWSIDGELLEDGLTSKIKNTDINFFQRVVDEMTDDLSSSINADSNIILTEKLLSLIGLKTNMTSKFLSTSFLVAGLLYSNLRSKFPTSAVGDGARQNFYEIERKDIYDFFNLQGRRNITNLSSRISISEDIIREKIFPKRKFLLMKLVRSTIAGLISLSTNCSNSMSNTIVAR